MSADPGVTKADVSDRFADARHSFDAAFPMQTSRTTAGSTDESAGSVIDVSVVVPTFNRAERLDALLTALLEQQADGVHFDVWVVDNASTDGTPALVSRFAARDTRVHYVLET